MSLIRLRASAEVVSRLLPFKGRVVEGRVVGKAGNMPLLEVGDMVFPAESKVFLKPGSRVSLWVRGLSGNKLHLQLLSQEELDEGFFKLGLENTPEVRLSYKFLKALGVEFSRSDIEVLANLILKSADPYSLLELLRLLSLRIGFSSGLLRFLLELGDFSSLRDLILRLMLSGDDNVRSFLKSMLPKVDENLPTAIARFLYESGILRFSEFSERLLFGGKSADAVKLLCWLFLPKILSLPPKEGEWFIFLWFPLLYGNKELSVPLLKKHKSRKREREEEERYELILELKSLGRIRVLFYLFRGKIWITFEAEDERTLMAFRRRFHELLSGLESAGYNVGGISSRPMISNKEVGGEGVDIRA